MDEQLSNSTSPETEDTNENLTSNEIEINDFLNNILSTEQAVPVTSDNNLVELDPEYLSHHNKDYSALLDIYIENARYSLQDKRRYKKIFYYSSLIVLASIIITLLISIIIAFTSKSSLQTIVTLITVATSFMTAFIVIPKTIAEFLFNTSDETNFTEIIKNMQNYDKSVREHIHTNKEE